MKQFVKNFNNLIKNTIFKVKNKTNNKFKVSSFNRFLITLISLLFISLFYLLIPTLYDKNWVQQNIEHNLLKEFKINFSLSSDISYNILPSPHFLIKDTIRAESTPLERNAPIGTSDKVRLIMFFFKILSHIDI